MSGSDAPPAHGVVLLRSTQGAIGAEKLLAAAGIVHKLIPVPRRLGSACGFCVRFAWADRSRVEAALAPAPSLGVEGIVPL